MNESLHFPEYSPSNRFYLFLSLLAAVAAHFALRSGAITVLKAPYLRGWPFYFAEIVTFVFGLLVMLDVAFFLRRERRAADALGRLFGPSRGPMSPPEAAQLATHLRTDFRPHRRTISYYRALRTIEFFEQSGSAGATSEYDGTIATITRNDCATHFEYIRYCIWVIPILGFIGTIWGITSAVSNFSRLLGKVQPGQESQELLASLQSIAANLSIAFETTLPALIASGLLALALSFLDRATDRLLLRIDRDNIDMLVSRLRSPVGITAELYERVLALSQTLAATAGLSPEQQATLARLLALIKSAAADIGTSQNFASLLQSSADAWEGLRRALQQVASSTSESRQALARPLDQLLRIGTEQRDAQNAILATLTKHFDRLEGIHAQLQENTAQVAGISTAVRQAERDGIPLRLEIIPSLGHREDGAKKH